VKLTTRPSLEELEAQRDYCIEKGKQVYRHRLQAILEPEHIGKFVAIEPDSGSYYLGQTSHEALAAAKMATPEHVFYLVRVGFKFAHRIGGGRSISRKTRFQPYC
jgi:hypothetical protein